MKALLRKIHAALEGARFDPDQNIEANCAIAALKALMEQWPLGSENYNFDVAWRFVRKDIDSAASDILMDAFLLVPPDSLGDERME